MSVDFIYYFAIALNPGLFVIRNSTVGWNLTVPKHGIFEGGI